MSTILTLYLCMAALASVLLLAILYLARQMRMSSELSHSELSERLAELSELKKADPL